MSATLTNARNALTCAGLTLADICSLSDREIQRRVPGLGRRGIAALRSSAKTVIVTRHRALIELLVERGIIPPCEPGTRCECCAENAEYGRIHSDTRYRTCRIAGVPILEHANAEDVAGRHVIGVLPLALAAHAASVTEIPLALAPADRGRELDLPRLRQIAGAPVTYIVSSCDPAVGG